MARPVINDELWRQIEPLLPPPKVRRSRFPGRKPLDHRKVLTGIIFVLKTGLPWSELPMELGCGSGMSCLNYLRQWQKQGLWDRLQQVLQAELQAAGEIDWARACAARSTRQRKKSPV